MLSFCGVSSPSRHSLSLSACKTVNNHSSKPPLLQTVLLALAFLFLRLGTKWRTDTTPKPFFFPLSLTEQNTSLFSEGKNNAQLCHRASEEVERAIHLRLLEVPCERIPGTLPAFFYCAVYGQCIIISIARLAGQGILQCAVEDGAGIKCK